MDTQLIFWTELEEVPSFWSTQYPAVPENNELVRLHQEVAGLREILFSREHPESVASHERVSDAQGATMLLRLA